MEWFLFVKDSIGGIEQLDLEKSCSLTLNLTANSNSRYKSIYLFSFLFIFPHIPKCFDMIQVMPSKTCFTLSFIPTVLLPVSIISF